MSSKSEEVVEIEGRLKQSLKSPYPENGTVWSALIETLADEIEEIETARDRSEKEKFITDASKNGLDRIAELFQVERKSDETDSEFRVRLQVILRSQLTSATSDEVLEVVRVFLDTNRDQIEMRENRGGEDAQFIISIPANTVGEMGLPTTTINSILGDISAAGVDGISTLKTQKVDVKVSSIPTVIRLMSELDTQVLNVGYGSIVKMEENRFGPAVLNPLSYDATNDNLFENALSSTSLNAISGNNWMDGMNGDNVLSPYSFKSLTDQVSHRHIGATTAGALLNVSLLRREMNMLTQESMGVLVNTMISEMSDLEKKSIGVSVDSVLREMTGLEEYVSTLSARDLEIEMANDIAFSSEDTKNLSAGGWKGVSVRNNMVDAHVLSHGDMDVQAKTIKGTTAPLKASARTLVRDMEDMEGEKLSMSPSHTGASILNERGISSRNINVLSAGSWT